MPRVGSSMMKIDGSDISHLASTTFCWLPPDRLLAGCDIEPALMLSASATARRPRRRRSLLDEFAAASAANFGRAASAMFSAIAHVHQQAFLAPVLGDEGDAAADAARAASRDRPARRRRRISPESNVSRPNRMRASSVRPEPIRPNRPSTSPLCRARLDVLDDARGAEIAASASSTSRLRRRCARRDRAARWRGRPSA